MSFDKGSPLTVLRLYCSLPLCPDYNAFRSKLKGSLLRHSTGDENIDTVLGVLRTETETGVVVVVDRDEMGGCTAASATDQDENMAEANQLQTPVADTLKMDDALKILVHNATQEFGFSPRDVYDGVFNFPDAKEEQASAVQKLDYSELKTLAKKFSNKGTLSGFSDRVVAVCPGKGSPKIDKWEIHFKSPRIARQTMKSMQLEEEKYLRGTFDILRKIPEGAVLTGWIFETIVHRMLSFGWRSDAGPTPQSILMVGDNCDSPTFFVPLKSSADTKPTPQPIRTVSSNRGPPTISTGPFSLSPSTPGTPLSLPKPKNVTLVDFPNLSNVMLDKNTYYMPSASNYPLFDSFIIEHEDDLQILILSVFQITISTKHGRSAEGYPYIRDIMKHLKRLDPNAIVKVRYFLVCSDKGDESSDTWVLSICLPLALVYSVFHPHRLSPPLYVRCPCSHFDRSQLLDGTFSPCIPSKLYNNIIAHSPVPLLGGVSQR